MEDQRENIVNLLNRNGYASKLDDFGNIETTILFEGLALTIICALPRNFPFELPELYIDDSSGTIIPHIPHLNLNSDGTTTICTFDKSVVFPNFFNPSLVALAVMDQGKLVIERGLSGTNSPDYLDKFDAYWSRHSETFAYCIASLEGRIKQLVCYYFEGIYYIADDTDHIWRMIGITEIKDQLKATSIPCIYLPDSKQMTFPLPRTCNELYQYVKECSTQYEAYVKFLSQSEGRHTLIVFSQEYKNSHIFEAWLHPIVKSRNGFRRGHTSIYLAMIAGLGTIKVEKITIKNISQKRLFERGGDGLQSTLPEVSIVGCGSLGGYLADALEQLGVSKFQLVDNDILSIDNIARHLCGLSYVGKKKVDALKEKLEKHNPNIECNALSIDAHNLLGSKKNTFENQDFVFIAVGSVPVEYRFVEQINMGKIKGSIIILWVEPFMAGGHAIIINHQQDIYPLLFSGSDLSFLKHIVDDPSKYSKREAGCQSSYLPYSGFEARLFIYQFTAFFWDAIVKKKSKHNYLFSWVGKLTRLKEQGIGIAENWTNSNDYSVCLERID